MKILAIDTSSIVATCAILDDDKILAEYILNHKMTHSQTIMPMIEQVLDSLNLKPTDIDVYAAAKGPGSFTGLRIGIATIKGLAHATSKAVVGVSTLDALAFNLPFSEGIVVPMMDARRDRVFTGIYKWSTEGLSIVMNQDVLEIDELIKILKERNENIVFNGDGTLVFKDRLIKELGKKANFAPRSVNMARASSVAELAMQKAKEGTFDNLYELAPDYLRESQAQREFDNKKTKCGEVNE